MSAMPTQHRPAGPALDLSAVSALAGSAARSRPQPRAASRSDWCRLVANEADGSAELWIYDEIGIWGYTATDLIYDLNRSTATELTVHLNSPGGEVFDGVAIYETLRAHPARVTVKVDSLAASIASVIAQAGDEVIISRVGQMMIHDAHGICLGNAGDMRQLADLLDRVSDMIAGVYATRAGNGAADAWRERMHDETWYSAEEAVAAGLATSLGEPAERAAEQPAARAFDLSVFAHRGRQDAPAPVPVSTTARRPVATSPPAPPPVGTGPEVVAGSALVAKLRESLAGALGGGA